MKYRILFTLDDKDYPGIDEPRIVKNEIVYSFHGCTYGCISNEGQAVTRNADGSGPFFEVPKLAIEEDNL